MRVVVLGAGGLGTYLGAVLHEAGHDVLLVARGAHLRALHEHGAKIVERSHVRTLAMRASSADGLDEVLGKDEGPFDVAFVTVKANAVVAIAPAAAKLAAFGTCIVPLTNGVEAPATLVDGGVAPARVHPGVAYLTAFRVAEGVVERQGSHARLVFESASEGAAGCSALSELAGQTDISIELVPDVAVEAWKKMALVCALAALCGPDSAPLGRARAAGGAALQREVVAEVTKVGRAEGVGITSTAEAGVHRVIDAFDDDFFPSLVHDLRTGVATEVAALNGAVVRLGRAHGIPTPRNELAARAIRLNEERARP